MKQFKNEWFSSLEDLREAIEEDTDYVISELNNEVVCVCYSNDDDEDIYETYRLGGTERTIYIDFESKRTEVIR
jgi:hypothetical protein